MKGLYPESVFSDVGPYSDDKYKSSDGFAKFVWGL